MYRSAVYMKLFMKCLSLIIVSTINFKFIFMDILFSFMDARLVSNGLLSRLVLPMLSRNASKPNCFPPSNRPF